MNIKSVTNIRRVKGFTIIELMIVVVIVGVIAAIAVGAYDEQTDRTYLAETQSALVQFANAMERSYTESVPSSYENLADGGGDTGKPANFFTQSPIDGNDKMYDLTIKEASAGAYVLMATPIAGRKMAGTGRLEFDSVGQRCWYEGKDTGDDSDACTEW